MRVTVMVFSICVNDTVCINTIEKESLFCPPSRIWLKSESDVRPSMVTNTRNLCSAFIPSKEHTHSSEHTPGAVGSHLCCGARGAVEGSVPCSRTPQSWYWGWRKLTPPTYNSFQTWDSNSQPLGYESNSLTIRPRLPLASLHISICVHPKLLCFKMFVKKSVFICQ